MRYIILGLISILIIESIVQTIEINKRNKKIKELQIKIEKLKKGH